MRTLSAFGDCSAATSGEEALSAVKTATGSEVPFDLITLDPRLQAPDGGALLTALRAAEAGHEGTREGSLPRATRAKVWLSHRSGRVPFDPGLIEHADGSLPTPPSTEAVAQQLADCGLLV